MESLYLEVASVRYLSRTGDEEENGDCTQKLPPPKEAQLLKVLTPKRFNPSTG
jgi:hypothetical protein